MKAARITPIIVVLMLLASTFIANTNSRPIYSQPQETKYPVLQAKGDSTLLMAPQQRTFNKTVGNTTIQAEITTTVFYPGYRGFLNINITNADESATDNITVLIKAPYFLLPGGNITVQVNTTNKTFSYQFLEKYWLGTIEPNNTMIIEIPFEGANGLEDTGTIEVTLYNDTNELWYLPIDVISKPAISLNATLSQRVLNISKNDTVEIHISVQNVFPLPTNSGDYLELYNITIKVDSEPEANFSEKTFVIKKLNNTEPPINITVTAKVSVIGVYEFIISAECYKGYLVNENKWIDYQNALVVRKTLITSTAKLIIFDEGHNQYYRFASEGMKGLIELLREGGPVLINKGEFSPELLDPNVTKLIVIPNPQPPSEGQKIFTDNEVSEIQSFLENGGVLLMMGNWYRYFDPQAELNGFDAITGKYGIYWIDGDVYDPTNNFGSSWNIMVKTFAQNEYSLRFAKDVDYVHYAGTALNITSDNTTYEVYPLLLGNPETYVTNGTESDPVIFSGANVIMGVLSKIGKGTLLAFGSSYMFSDYYYFSDNKPYIENIVYWLFQSTKMEVTATLSKLIVKEGETVELTINIKNKGAAPIKDVKLEITLPEGISTTNETSITIGDLNPGEAWEGKIVLKAKKAGDYIIKITVKASNYETIVKGLTLSVQATGIPSGAIAIGIIIIVIVAIGAITYKKLRPKS